MVSFIARADILHSLWPMHAWVSLCIRKLLVTLALLPVLLVQAEMNLWLLFCFPLG